MVFRAHRHILIRDEIRILLFFNHLRWCNYGVHRPPGLVSRFRNRWQFIGGERGASPIYIKLTQDAYRVPTLIRDAGIP